MQNIAILQLLTEWWSEVVRNQYKFGLNTLSELNVLMFSNGICDFQRVSKCSNGILLEGLDNAFNVVLFYPTLCYCNPIIISQHTCHTHTDGINQYITKRLSHSTVKPLDHQHPIIKTYILNINIFFSSTISYTAWYSCI